MYKIYNINYEVKINSYPNIILMENKTKILATSALILAAVSIVNAKQKKNVLFLMADDFNFWLHEIGYYPQALTPNLDKLANRGVLFTDAHCSSPVCNPSRNALWSGVRPASSGIMGNQDGYIREIPGFENIVSMHQYFMQNGYYAYGAGKLWHPGRMGVEHTDKENWSEINPIGTGSPGGNINRWSANMKGYSWSAGEFNLKEDANDTKMAYEVAEFITNYKTNSENDQPFFIGCGFFRPHLPWNCHKQFWDLFSPDTLQIPKGYLENDNEDIPVPVGNTEIHAIINKAGKWKEGIWAYLANLAYADYNVGIVLDALDKSPYKENTIVLFMGDHGWHLGEKNRWSKHEVYDQANHTTLIIYDPSAKGNGNKCTKVVSMQDLYPTLVELCGLPVKKDIEGRSIAPLLKNPEDKKWNWPILMSYNNVHYIKTNEWRFIDEGDKSQLYHTAVDPYEWVNLFGKSGYDNIVEKLRFEIDSIRNVGRKMWGNAYATD